MKIEKRSYSSNPWRLIDDAGDEVYLPQRFNHPHLGHTTISAPVCGKTKAEVVQLSLGLLAKVAEENVRLRAELKTLNIAANDASNRIEKLEKECENLRGRKCTKCRGEGTVQRWTGEYVECDACDARGFGL